jgi:hypothetical protein
MKRYLRVLTLLSAVAWHAAAAQGAFGIAPVYDSSGNPWGPIVSQYLTLYLFEALRPAGVPAELLNPGGVYTPLDTSWLADYVGDRPGVKTLLATSLVPAVYIDKSKTRLRMTLTAVVLDRSGQRKEEFKASTEIKPKDTDVESSFLDPHAHWKLGLTTGHRVFDKSPLGKAALALADQMRIQLQSYATISTVQAATSGGVPCPVNVKITYAYRHGAASQAYTLIVNGLDQSMNINSGVAAFKAVEGPMLVQMSVADAPYKLAAQDLYQFSTTHTCGKGTYVIDLGKSGDAHDRWE